MKYSKVKENYHIKVGRGKPTEGREGVRIRDPLVHTLRNPIKTKLF